MDEARPNWRRLRRAGRTVTVGLAAGAVVLGAAAMIARGRLSGEGLTRAWQSSQFRLFVAIAGVSVLLFSLAGGYLWHVGRRRVRRFGRPDGQSGTAILEFAMILPFMLMLGLLMLQSSLLMGGYLCVNYASYCAARAAIVQVPRLMTDEDRNQIADYDQPDGSEKLWRIHRAAVWAVMPTGDGAYGRQSDYTDVLVEGVTSIWENTPRTSEPTTGSNPLLGQDPDEDRTDLPDWVGPYLGRKLAYAEDNTFVTLTAPSDGETFGEHEDLTVTVWHNLYLSVPYANWMLAKLDSDHAIEFGEGRYALTVEIPCTLTNEGVPDYIEVEDFPN